MDPARTSLPAADLAALAAAVRAVPARGAGRPGGRTGRQPVHTVYVPAHAFGGRTVAGYARTALELLDAHAPDAAALAAAIELDPAAPAGAVRDRVVAKLVNEPVEDLRVDFEDGYRRRGDDAEDHDVSVAAEAVAAMAAERALPRRYGLRVAAFADGRQARALRTLDAFLTGLADRLGRPPPGFVVTFPKVVAADHVRVFVEALARLEAALGLVEGSLRLELQVETLEAVIDPDGRIALPALARAAGPRLSGVHLGVFDYTAACGLPPGEQRLDHPACDFARHLMQVTLAGTGVELCDGSTNVVPGGREPGDGRPPGITAGAPGDTRGVHLAWRAHARHVRHSLRHGFYQGWDLHPAQLVSRFATVYAFHLTGLAEVVERVRAAAGRSGPGGAPPAGRAAGAEVMDEPATLRALTERLRRAVDSGAVEEADIRARTGLTPAALHGTDPSDPPEATARG